MARPSRRGLSASEVLAILDADSDDDTELVSLDLDAESDDEQPAGDFMSPDGTQSLLPNDVLSFSGAFQSLILDDTNPSHRYSLLLSDLSLPDQGRKEYKNMKLTMQLHQHGH